MTFPAPGIRNSAKALILRDGAVLLQVCRINGRLVHLLPGGGQETGEPLEATVRREVLEETGLRVQVGSLLWVREFISSNHLPNADGSHAVEFIFRCTPETGAELGAGAMPDSTQIDVRWTPLAELPRLTMWPEMVKRQLIAWHETGDALSPAYLGDCS